MHNPEIICAILKDVEGLAPKPVLEKDSCRLRNNMSGQPVMTNRSTLRLVLITFFLEETYFYLFHLQLVDLLSSRVFLAEQFRQKHFSYRVHTCTCKSDHLP